jgi:hypothetical protein
LVASGIRSATRDASKSGHPPPSKSVLTLNCTAARSDKAFLIEDCCDLPVHFARAIQLRNSLPQPLDVNVVAIGVNAPLQVMLAGSARLPYDFEPNHAACPLLVEDHFAHNKAQNALAISERRGGGVPNPGGSCPSPTKLRIPLHL